jgi:hypothetical protein
MRIHFAAAAAVLILALWIGVDRIELVVLLLAIAFVLIAEMVNSAIEAAIDVATSLFDPWPSWRRTSPRAVRSRRSTRSPSATSSSRATSTSRPRISSTACATHRSS